ncbi:unnamed protein product [Durusdinium trenchii]|uniref:Amino acid transporter transmembrane domain-containing protein n=1 Tax=Durusdinium trenchii TaxID=1381693 RepID=A0ABP0IC04_9DINO
MSFPTPPMRERMESATDDVADLGAPAGLGSRATSFYERSRINKTFSPLTAGGIRQSIFVLVQTSLGGGILTIAYMMRQSGFLLGIILLLLAGGVAAVSMEVLMKSAVLQHRYTLGNLMSFVFGQSIGVALDLMLFLYGNGSLITYFIFLGDFIPSIVEALSPGYWPQPTLERELSLEEMQELDELRTKCLVAALLLVLLPSLPRDLSGLRYLSPIMAIGIIYTEAVVVWKCFWLHLHHPDLTQGTISEMLWPQDDLLSILSRSVKAFSLCVFSYVCHLNVTPVAKELENANDRRIEKVSWRVVFVQFGIYVLLAVAGYGTFGDDTKPNLLQNYSASDPWILASRVGLTFTVLVAIATNTNPTVRASLCLLEVLFPFLKEPALEGPNAEPLLKTPPLMKRAPEEPRPRRYVRYCLSIACLTMDTLVAIYVKNVASVVGFLGATMGTLMMMVIPGWDLYNADEQSYHWCHRHNILHFALHRAA